MVTYVPQGNVFRVTFHIPELERDFRATVDGQLKVLDGGLCLTDHDTGKDYTAVLDLISLPSVLREAHERNKYVDREWW